MSQLFVWALSLVLMVPSSWGRSPARVQPFQQYVDYQKFTELSREDQKSMIITLMETMAMMEQELIDADKIYTIDMERKAQIKKKKTVLLQLKKYFETFASQASLPVAYARTSSEYNAYCPAESVNGLRGKHTTETCMYGSYMSNMIRDGDKFYCVRPACSNIPAFRDAHNQAASAGRCSPASMACNPKIYGFAKDTQNRRVRPNCVQVDFVERNAVSQWLSDDGRERFQNQATVSNDAAPAETFHNISHNVSLACYMEVMNDNAGGERVNQIVDNILRDSSAAQDFNNMLSIITNVCICSNVTDARQPSRQDAYVNNFSQSYVGYMQGHRTCNALIAQLELVGDKLTSDQRYCSRQELPRNLKSFIEGIRPYRALHLRVNNSITQPNSERSRSEAMRRLRNRWVVEEGVSITGGGAVTRVANGRGLDKVGEYERAVTSIQSNTQVCPLTFQDPQEFTCRVEILTAPTRQALGLVAKLIVINNREGQEVVPTVKWKIGNTDLPASLNGVELTHTLVPVEGTTPYSLSAEATFTRGVNTNVVPCTPAPFELTGEAPSPSTCTLSPLSGTFTIGTDGKPVLSATPTATPPANTPGTIAWFQGDAPVTLSALSAAADASTITLKAKFNPATGTPIECGSAIFTKAATPTPTPPNPPTPAEPTCRLTATAGTFTIANGKFVLSGLPTSATLNPPGTQGTLAWFQGANEVNPSDMREVANATTVTLEGKFKRQSGTPIACGSMTFNKAAPPQNTPKSCTVSISSPTAQTRGNPPFDVNATVVVKDQSDKVISDIGNGVIKWMLNGRELNKNLMVLQGEKSDTRDVKVSATVNGMSCGDVSVVVAEPPAPPQAEKKGCDLAVTQAPAGPGLFSVEASVSPAPDKDQTVSFSGMGELKPVEGKKDVARGNIAGIAQAQKKTVKAKYKAGGKDLECQKEIEIPAAQASGPAGPGQQPFVPPAEGSFLLQKRGVN